MPVPLEVRPYELFLDRVVVHRVKLIVTAENAAEAAKLAERELYADKADVPSECWKPVATDFYTRFAHRAEDVAIVLKEKVESRGSMAG